MMLEHSDGIASSLSQYKLASPPNKGPNSPIYLFSVMLLLPCCVPSFLTLHDLFLKEGSQPVELVDALEVVLRLNLAQALIKLNLGGQAELERCAVNG